MIDKLANELKHIIFIEFLDLRHHPSELRNIAAVCRALYDFLHPFLWHRIRLKVLDTLCLPDLCAAVLAELFPTGQRPLNTNVKELCIDDLLPTDEEDLDEDVPSSAISLDPKLPDLLRQLPSLQKLGLFDMNWTVLPLLDAVKHCLAIPSLKTFVIASDEFPLGILEHCRHVKTLCLSGDANVSTEFNVNTPELRNLHLDIHSHEFRTVWRHLDTSKLEKLAVQHRLESYDQHTSIYPPECANLRSLTVTFSEDDPFEHDWIDDWPRFESLAELRELNVVYKTKVYEQDLEDRPERLAGWLGRIDPVMRQLECLNITFFVTFPDSIVSKEFEELQELDSQLACLQSATLKKVVIAVCPNDSEGSADPRKRYEAFGAAGLGASTEADGESEREEVWQALKLLDEVRGTPMEREVTERVMRALALVPERKGVTQEELEARTAGSVKVIWDSLKASRARAPDFISVKVCKSEDVPWYHKVLEE